MALNEPEPWAWQYQEYLDTHWQLQFLSSCPEARSHPSRECIAFGFVCKLMDTICYALQFLDVCIFYDKTMHRSWVLPSSGPGERERTVDRQILWTPLGRACNMWSRREWEASDEASSQSEGLLQIKQPIRGLVTERMRSSWLGLLSSWNSGFYCKLGSPELGLTGVRSCLWRRRAWEGQASVLSLCNGITMVSVIKS